MITTDNVLMFWVLFFKKEDWRKNSNGYERTLYQFKIIDHHYIKLHPFGFSNLNFLPTNFVLKFGFLCCGSGPKNFSMVSDSETLIESRKLSKFEEKGKRRLGQFDSRANRMLFLSSSIKKQCSCVNDDISTLKTSAYASLIMGNLPLSQKFSSTLVFV